jgi:methyltransferase (TIGR00027 family)
MLHVAKHSHTLASTARWTAAVRARESEREDRLFHDPWAAALAGPEGLAWIAERSDDSVVAMVLRTRFFDDFLQRIVSANAIRQVVLMAAGLDTRAFRLDWTHGTRLFELDQAPVLEYKARILRSASAAPTCERQTIAVDLTAPWEEALMEAGFAPQQPSGWLFEGFLFYLPSENVTDILDRSMSLAAPGSYIGFDIINSITLTSPLMREWVQMQADAGAPWIGALDDPEGFLAARGWKATLVPPGAPEANHNRWPYPVIPAEIPGIPRLWFVVGRNG